MLPEQIVKHFLGRRFEGVKNDLYFFDDF
nr:hypothetical protein [Sicyoidochytrium minutum DNA virus]